MTEQKILEEGIQDMLTRAAYCLNTALIAKQASVFVNTGSDSFDVKGAMVDELQAIVVKHAALIGDTKPVRAQEIMKFMTITWRRCIEIVEGLAFTVQENN